MRKRIVTSSIIGIVILMIFGGIYFWYSSNYNTENYYTQITDRGTKFTETDNSNNKNVNYVYHQPAYNGEGKKIVVKFNNNMNRPLKLHAYLKVGYNAKRNQVISWEKVDKKDIPQKALKHISY